MRESGEFIFPVIIFGGVVAFALFAVVNGRWNSPRARDEDQRRRERYFLVMLVLIGLLVRIALAGGIRAFDVHTFLAPDEGTFHSNGVQFAWWLRGETPYRLSVKYLDSLQVGYFYLVGVIYFLLAEMPILPILANCVFGALAAIPVYWIARELAGTRAARAAAVLATFFPSVVLWSTLLIRDSLVILVLLTIIAMVMSLKLRFSMVKLLFLILLFAILGTLRQYLFLLVATASVAGILVGRSGRTGRSVAAGIVAVLALIVVMKVAGFGIWELERASLHNLNVQRQYNSGVRDARASFMPEVDISEPANAITYLPIGMLYFLGSPFPWQVFSTRQALAVPDVLIWYALIPFAFIGLRATIRHRWRDAAPLLLCISMITVLYSLVEGNIGIIFRHRAQVLVPLMVFAGIGFAVRAAKKAGRTSPLVKEKAAGERTEGVSGSSGRSARRRAFEPSAR